MLRHRGCCLGATIAVVLALSGCVTPTGDPPDRGEGGDAGETGGHCTNGVKDGNEAGVDCGGPDCAPCDSSFHWEAGQWSSCSETCGGGTKTRTVQCVDEFGNPALGRCDESVKPSSSKMCNTDPCTKFEWETGKWSDCSAMCGTGTQSRSVECVKQADDTTVDDSKCSGSKPEATRPCMSSTDCNYEWKTGSWSTCNSSCKQTRDVVCRNKTLGKDAPDSKCSGTKPASEQQCSGGQCPSGTESMCDDGKDNDGDGTTDCADSDCSGASSCSSSTSEAPVFCDDGKDNDNDGVTDCEDPECKGHDCGPGYNGYEDAVCENMVCVEKNCSDMDDDDQDGLKNCQDPDCSSSPNCTSTSSEANNCTDGKDNDNDGDADCTDADCISKSVCTSNGESGLDCDDGKDNDGDGDTDCADSGCLGQDCDVKGNPYGGAVCHGGSCVETNCSNGEDDDDDGQGDSADPNCP